MAELKNLENELDRFRLRLIAAGAFVLLAFALLGARLSYLQVVRYEDLSAQAETNRTAVLPIVPNRGRILDRNGEVLATNYSAYTLEITPSKVEDLDATIDEPVRRGRDRRARQAPLQAAAGRRQELRLAADPHQAQRRGSGALHGAALPFPGRGRQGAAVPQLPAGRDRQPPAGLHRPHQPGREEADGRLAGRAAGQLQGHRIHRQARPGAELRGRAARPDRLRARRDQRRRPRGAPPEQPRADAGQHAGAVDRHPAAGAGGGHVRRPARRAGGHRPAQRRGAGLRQQAHLRPEPVRRRHRRGQLARAERVDRQAAAEPRAARHLPAGLDLQALHGDGGAEHRQARAEHHHPGQRHLRLRQPCLPQPRRQGPGAGGHVPLDRQVEQRLLLLAGQRDGRGPDARAAVAAGLRPQDRDRPRGRSHRRAAVHRVEAPLLQAPRAAEVVRRRDHLAGHRPGLQRLHHAAAGQRHGHAGVGRPALQAAAGARDRGRGHATRSGAWPTTRSSRCPTSPSTSS